MRITLLKLLIFSFGFIILTSSSEKGPLADEYLSPEHLYLDQSTHTMYIGLATHSGIGVFDIEKVQLQKILSMPSPVSGIVVDEEKQLLYAGAKNGKAEVYVVDLKQEKVMMRIPTGHGPAALAISTDKGYLFVANRFSNDVSVIDLQHLKEIKRIDVGREPVALALSPDESTLAVANLLPSQAATESYIAAKISLVDTEDLSLIKHINLPNGAFAVKDILFSKEGDFIYTTHLTGRYNVLTSQIEKGWINTNAISIIDATKKELYTTVLLDDIYKGAANPNGLSLSADGVQLFVAISGTNELFVIDRIGMHQRIEHAKTNVSISQSTNPVTGNLSGMKVFEDPNHTEQVNILFEQIPNELSFLAPVRQRIKLQGYGPVHVVYHRNTAYISSYFSDGIEVLNVSSGEKEKIELGAKDISLSAERYGAMLFHSADNCFQQWQSCASCHPGEGRVDGLNWDLMNDGIGNPKNTKSLLYAHATPPVMISGIRKDAETGVRAGFKYIQFFDAPEEKAKAVDAYLKSLKPVPSPYLVNGNLSEMAKQGKKIFERRSCNHCHSGTYFTNMEQFEMGSLGKYDKQRKWDTPTLIELWRTAPYLHDGRYANLKDVFKKGKHGLKEPISEKELMELSEYLLSL